MSANIYVQKDKKIKQARKKGRKEGKKESISHTIEMDNQKAHTEADKERRGQFIRKVSPPSTN